MDAKKKRQLRLRRHSRLRKKVKGTATRPRLVVYKSLNHFYAQAIDDVAGNTIVAANSLMTEELKKSGGNIKTAVGVADLFAERAKKAGVIEVVFDHGGFGYRGKIREFADTLRKRGLKF